MTPFEQPDFLYCPSSDVQRDVEYFTGVLGGRLVFTVEAMGTRVAAIELAPEGRRAGGPGVPAAISRCERGQFRETSGWV